MTDQVDADDGWVSATTASRILHVTPKTIRRYAAAGKLPYLRTLGGWIKVRSSDLRILYEALTETEGQDFEALLVDSPRSPPKSDRPRDSSGHVRPQPVLGRTMPKLRWREDSSGQSVASSGPGWSATITRVNGGFRATVRLEGGEQLHWPNQPTIPHAQLC
ncbi:MAG TPA: helix-turn-helix domain-containing protein [Actinomycetota bacterium]|nr:helix-turn-helix domain-containing protein [Actinomycetota bacterium]